MAFQGSVFSGSENQLGIGSTTPETAFKSRQTIQNIVGASQGNTGGVGKTLDPINSPSLLPAVTTSTGIIIVIALVIGYFVFFHKG